VRFRHSSPRRIVLVLILFTSLLCWVLSFKPMGQFSLSSRARSAALLSRDGRLIFLSWQPAGRLPWIPQEHNLLPVTALLPVQRQFVGFSFFHGVYQDNPSYARTTVICPPYWMPALLAACLLVIPTRRGDAPISTGSQDSAADGAAGS
jgi:hypothetical protein